MIQVRAIKNSRVLLSAQPLKKHIMKQKFDKIKDR